MHRSPTLLRAYVGVLGTVGVGVVAWGMSRIDWADGRTTAVVAGLALAALVAELAPARVRDGFDVSLVTIVTFTAVLLGGAEAAVVAMVGYAIGTFFVAAPPRGLKTAFNFGQMVISAGIAGATYTLLGGRTITPSVAIEELGLGQLALTSLALTAANLLFIAVLVWLRDGEPVHATARSLAASSATLQLVYVLLAVVAAVLVQTNPVALVLLLVPLMVARAGLLGFQEQDEATDRMVKAFVKALEVKDGYTRGHAERVAALTEKVAAEMGFSYDERRMAGYAALLHDIGKIGVPTAVITKRGPLDDEEFAAIKRHPTVGAEMLRDIDFLVPALDVVRHHHERYDGRGYPYGLAGERIPPLARMVSVVDAFDAMTSTRSYRKALPVDVALRELDRCAGTQFDVDAVKALHRVIAREGWELTTDPVGEVVSRAGQVRALAREVVSEAAG